MFTFIRALCLSAPLRISAAARHSQILEIPEQSPLTFPNPLSTIGKVLP
jgi:hypothetical protein